MRHIIYLMQSGSPFLTSPVVLHFNAIGGTKPWPARRSSRLIVKQIQSKVCWNKSWCQIQLIGEGVGVLFVGRRGNLQLLFFFFFLEKPFQPPLQSTGFHFTWMSLNAMTVSDRSSSELFSEHSHLMTVPLLSYSHCPHETGGVTGIQGHFCQPGV